MRQIARSYMKRVLSLKNNFLKEANIKNILFYLMDEYGYDGLCNVDKDGEVLCSCKKKELCYSTEGWVCQLMNPCEFIENVLNCYLGVNDEHNFIVLKKRGRGLKR